MRELKVINHARADRHNSVVVQPMHGKSYRRELDAYLRRVRRVIVRLNVVHVNDVRHAGYLVHVTNVVADVGVLHNSLLIAFEVHDIHLAICIISITISVAVFFHAHLVESEERHYEADISESQGVATKVSLGGEQLFKTIQRFVELGHRFFICKL